MSVGIVVVSHSAALAEAAGELAREMAGAQLRLALAGGVDDPDHPLGTDAVRVLAAIEEVDGDDGVLVLMDLGSAVLSAELAVDLLPEGRRGRILLCEAPLIEGLVAAAVQAAAGADLDRVAAEARSGLSGKAAHLGVPASPDATASRSSEATAGPSGDEVTARLTVTNELGLHARPAARIVEAISPLEAVVTLEIAAASGSGAERAPVPAHSLNAIITLGARRGAELVVRARGADAAAAVDALLTLAAANFGDPAGDAVPRRAGTDDTSTAPRGVTGDTALIQGLPAAPGLAVGAICRLDHVPPRDVPLRRVESTEAEQRRLEEAVAQTAATIGSSRDLLTGRAGTEAGEMLAANLLLLEDPLLLDPASEAIADRVDAATAWQRSVEAMTATYRRLEDPYLAERARDVEAVGADVLARLLGDDLPARVPTGVVVATDLGPADTARLDPEVVDAIVTAAGSPTSHASLIARALGIPAVVGAGRDVTTLAEGSIVVVDGSTGHIQVDPDTDALTAARRTIEEQRSDGLLAREEAAEAALTRDGTRIEVAANIGLPGDADRAIASGADGVGLLRSEFLFLDRATAPDEDEQVEVYAHACRTLDGRPVVLRTLDVGGDKPLPYLDLPEEVNPFLGTRGLRLGLTRPSLLVTQLRAALRVGVDHPLRVMLPMVSTVAEIRAARELLEAARADLLADGLPAATQLELGVMVEVPALALQAEEVVREVDFVSIGTNDLTQYVMAAERGNSAVAHLADPLQPAILRLIGRVCEAGSTAGVLVTVCGDVAGDLDAVPLLLGLGVSELSVPPPAVPEVKRAIRRVDLGAARLTAQAALRAVSASDVRALLARSAQD